MKHIQIALIGLFIFATSANAQDRLKIEAPTIVLNAIPFDVQVTTSSDSIVLTAEGREVVYGEFERDGATVTIRDIVLEGGGSENLTVVVNGETASTTVYLMPGVVSILPPILAIALALITKQVILSLFSGIWLGATLILGGSLNPLTGFLRTLDTVLVRALTDTDQMMIILFTLILGGMVGILARSGGTKGIVLAMAKMVKTRKSGQIATWMMGILIFFDDYANSLLVGNTMRPFSDKLKLSREKLSYLVDSTSAPIASIALASTWIGFELGLIDASFASIDVEYSAYKLFLMAIPYSFYSLAALAMVLIIAITGRDYGPMLKAEHRAITEGKVLRDGAVPLIDEELSVLGPPEGVTGHWSMAIVPIFTMIAVLIGGLFYDGLQSLGPGDHPWRDIIGSANSFVVLIWGSGIGALVAAAMAIGGRVLTLSDTMNAFMIGLRAMIVGAIILMFAKSLQIIVQDLHTADFIFHISSGMLDPRFLPALTFIIAALISFGTGTAWGTMAILVPVVIPLAYYLPETAAIESPVLLGSLGAILSGAIFGDHCSPISDTTVLSSIASGADHIDHVRTQLPYGLTVAAVTLAFGYIPAGFGFNPWLGNLVALAALIVIVLKVGKKPGEA